MKIGIISSGLPPDHIGGAETQALNLARHLAKKHKVIIFTRQGPNISKIKINKNIKIKVAPFIKLPLLERVFFACFTLANIKKYKEDIDVLICYMPMQSLIGVLAKKLFNISVISSIRGEGEFKDISISRKHILNPYLFRNSDFIIVQTNKIKNEFIQTITRKLKLRIRHKINVIRNGIDLSRKNASGNKIVYAGRLIRGNAGNNDKGVRYLIEAVRIFDNDTLIIGYGPEGKRLREQAKGLKVKFTGRILPEKMRNYLIQGNIFVYPAVKGDGLPNTILEAMNVGLPIIATKTAGIPDIIKHGKTGFLVEPKNSEELRKYIEILLKDDKLRKRMSRNCLKEIRNYSWDKRVARYEVLFSRLK